jgi:hypothetical protein
MFSFTPPTQQTNRDLSSFQAQPPSNKDTNLKHRINYMTNKAEHFKRKYGKL